MQRQAMTFLFCLLCAVSAVAQTEIVVQSGQPIPNYPNSATTGLYWSPGYYIYPQINSQGTVLFSAQVNEPANNPVARVQLWKLNSQGISEKIAGATEPAINITGASYNVFSSAVLDDFDSVAFHSIIAGSNVQPGIDETAIWLKKGANTNLVVRRGNLAPGTTGNGYFRTLLSPSFGHLESAIDLIMPAHVGSLPGGSPAIPASLGVWKYVNGVTEKVYWSYLLPPGVVDTYFSSIFGYGSLTGNSLIAGQLSGVGVTTIVVNGISITTNHALWHTEGDNHILLARSGFQAPGLDEGLVFRTLPVTSTAQPVMGQGGLGAFVAQIIGPGVTVNNEHVLYTISRQGALNLRVRSGQPAPSLPSGVNFGPITASGAQGTLKVSSGNHIVFTSLLSGSGVTLANFRTIWRLNPDNSFELVARSGIPIQGLPEGVVIAPGFSLANLDINKDGTVVFTTQVLGTDITSANDYAIFMYNDGVLRAVAREGDVFGEYRIQTINSFTPQISEGNHIISFVDLYKFSGSGQGTKRGIIGISSQGEVTILAVKDAPIQTMTGATPTVNSLYVSNQGAINAHGQVVFVATFTSGTSAIIKTQMESAPQMCSADFNNNGVADVSDIFAFLSAWFAGNSTADVNNDGLITVADIFAFLSAWHAGC